MDKIKWSYNLSPMQEGILFHCISEPNSGVYIIQWLCTVKEPLDLRSFKRAWELVIERHDILRTRIEWESDYEPAQIVENSLEFSLNVYDWRRIPSGELRERFEEYLASDRFQGIKLDETPLFRVSLFQTADSEFRFIWTHHHIIIDGFTERLICEELFTFYHALTENRKIQLPKPRPYRDYIEWLSLQDFSREKEYWQTVLKGFSAPTQLPELNIISAEAHRKIYVSESLVLDKPLTSKLENFARDHGLRINLLLQGAWSLILYHYSMKEDVVFGIIRACRNSTIEGAPSVAGLFINNLPIRVQFNDHLSLIDLMKEIQRQNVELRQHENTPLVQIKTWSEVSADLQLFESLYVFDRGSYNDYFHAKGGRWLNLDFQEYNSNNYPITFLAFAGSEILLRLEYDQRRFEQWMVKRMLNGIRVLLEAMLHDPQAWAVNLPYMTEAEFSELAVWNATQRDYYLDQTLMDVFEEQVRRTPDSVALVDEDRRFTYGELSEQTNRLGRYLRRLGVGPEVLVGLFMERSLEMVVGIYGILKAGGAYMPLDPEYPADRLAFMIEDTKVPVILTQQHLVSRLPPVAARVICLDSEWDAIRRESGNNLEGEATADNAAYVIFTSGSTGRPKGVVNEHRGIVNRLLWMQDEYQLTAEDRILQKTPFSFDVSVWEFFWPLQAGAQLVVAKPGGHRDSAYLVDTIKRHGITTLHFVPSMLQIFLEEPEVESCDCIRRVICSGEALSYELQKRFFERLDAELHNLYGPTEAAVDVTYWACRRDSERPIVPIGHPVANTAMYILDPRMRPVPVGVTGELYIGGVQVARGYLNRPELTAERFIPDPFTGKPGARLYPTGDLAQYLPDGSIEYLGRADFQVKIHGLRVELGEIETRLEACDGVGHCTVALREDVPGDKRLVAYYVRRTGAEVHEANFRTRLSELLPDYMVPQHFVELGQMPLTASGKVDRKALPKPATVRKAEIQYLAPRNNAEVEVAKIWQDLLGLEKVGMKDNFFELGGHSLLVLRMVGRLKKQFARSIAVVNVFQHPTVERLAGFLSGATDENVLLAKTFDQGTKQREAIRKMKQRSAPRRFQP